MPIPAACDDCGWKGTVNNSLAGSKTKCPSCGEPMPVEDPEDDIQRKRAALAEGGDHSSPPGRSAAGGAGIGILMMVGAAVWFVGGLAIDHIFIYPPILFVLGLIQLFRSLAGRPN